MCTGTPFVSMSVAAVCRRTCSVPTGMPAAFRLTTKATAYEVQDEVLPELVAEHKIPVLVGVTCQRPFDTLRVAVSL